MTKRPNPAARQAFYSGWAVAFVGPCALKHGDEPIAFPKLDVVLAMHCSARRLAACSSMQRRYAVVWRNEKRVAVAFY